MKKYKDCPQHQYQLLPPSLEELIDPKHLVRVVDKFVSTLSATIWDHVFTGGGAPSYHPKMMLKIILYAYSSQIYSCRQIAKAVRQDVTFMWLAGMQQPNFNTINRFRSEYFRDILESVFTELLDFLHQKGYISFIDFFIDGSKLEADAGRYTHVWQKNTQRYKTAVQKRVQQLLTDIDKLNADEDQKYGDADLPERGETADISSQEIEQVAQQLSDQLTEINDKKSRRLLQSKINKLTTDAERLAKYEQQERVLDGRNSYSKTDPDATFMRLKDDRLRAAYNVQISTENQFITNYSISQNAADSAAFAQHVEKIISRGQQYIPNNYMGDSAYGTEENYTLLQDNGINNYLKYNYFHRDQKKNNGAHPFHRDNFSYDESNDSYQCPVGKRLRYRETIEQKTKTGFITHVRIYECEDCSTCPHKAQCTKATGNRTIYYNPTLEQYRAQARDNLNSEYGITLRKRRSSEVETPFGDIKHNRSFRRFYLRGNPKVEHEFGLHCIAHNLRKISFIEMKQAA
jgi:transposase